MFFLVDRRLIEAIGREEIVLGTCLLYLILAVTSESSVRAQDFSKFLCSSYTSVFKMSQEDVTKLLDTKYLLQYRSARLPNRVQCGLPGEEWKVCVSCSTKPNIRGFNKIKPLLANHEHREWHNTWHSIRNQLGGDGMHTAQATPESIEQWQHEGWLPPTQDLASFTADHKLGGNLAGEDFFYMHRQMIKMVQVEMANQGEPCLGPWQNLPSSIHDSEWPDLRTSPDFAKLEQNDLNDMRSILSDITRPEHLKSITLSELGNEIESRLHAKMHSYFNDAKSNCANGDPNKDDGIGCDDLTSDRSSHVNMRFYLLHGIIDQALEGYLHQHGKLYLSSDCKQTPQPDKCYQWKSTWIGKVPSSPST